MKKFIVFFSCTLFFICLQGQIIDHTCTQINAIPEWAIDSAKSRLHIAYGHTSHGNQLIEGMDSLIHFANNGGRGLSLRENIFTWSNTGSNGSLHLHNYFAPGDAGYYPQFYDETITYLEEPGNSDINVVMWAWCGQIDNYYEEGVLWDHYLLPMTQLEAAYPHITFVYMTGHLDYYRREFTNAANDSIRSFCQNNGKVLYDFADIESFGPDGTNYKYTADDACDVFNSNGARTGNWARDYQNTHTEGVDWYHCDASHTEPYNGNLKAYSAWWLFATLAGWADWPLSLNENEQATENLVNVNEISIELLSENPANGHILLSLKNNNQTLINIQLINGNGQIVNSDLELVQQGQSNTIVVDTTILDRGIYYVRVQSTSELLTQKILIL